MADNSQLHTNQYEFSAYIRDPDNNTAPQDIEGRRMMIYADLFFNNVRKFLAGHFPVLSNILGEDRWALLVRDYYRDHRSHSPLFPDMPREFLHYIAEERPTGKHSDPLADLPFMAELAHYEWVEAGLLLAPDDVPIEHLQTAGDLLSERPVISGLAWLLSYHWPVNLISKDNQPEQPADAPLHYLVYRGDDEDVHFLQLNVVSARLFELLRDEQCSGQTALETIVDELNHPDPEQVIGAGTQMLTQWRDKNILLGTIHP
jgi:hypothetical protein